MVEIEGPGWYQDFLDACADSPLTDPASTHFATLPAGKLYTAALDVCTSIEETVSDLRAPKNEKDRELALAAGYWKADFGDEPWFLNFARPIRIKNVSGKPAPLVAMAWSPPDEMAFIAPDGDVAFVQWPNGATGSDMVTRSNDYASLASWFLVVLTYRSAWRQGAFEFRKVTEAEYLADWMPAGGYEIVLTSESDPVPTTDGESQWIGR